MSLGAPGRHLAALIAAALVALLLQACALPGSVAHLAPPEPTPDPAEPRRPGTGAGELWQVIDHAPSGTDREWLVGGQPNRLLQPVSVAARGQLVYILDAGSRQLLRYDAALDRMTQVRSLQGVLSGDEADLFLHRDLSFYIADADGARVLHFDSSGRLLRTIEDRVAIGRPVSVVADDRSGYLFVADGFNDDVIVFNPAGRITGSIGIRGQGPGRFLGITALAQGPSGYYIGTRYGPARVQHMGHDGAFRESFEKDTVIFPTSIAAGPDGRVYVADYMRDDIKVYEGARLIGTIGGHGSAPGRFRRITKVWVDQGHLYVADSLNRRIQILTLASWEPGGSPDP